MSAQLLEFRYPDKAARWSDRSRILQMFEQGKITKEERDQWLQNGGHKPV
jgi:hypothetical protein